MNPVLLLFFGLAVIGLFFWYFAAERPGQKRALGTVLSLITTLFCLWAFIAPKNGRLFGNVPLGIDLQGGSSFIVQISPASPDRPVTVDVQEQARATLEKRLNAYGTVDMSIVPVGTDRLEIQMPGVKKEDFNAVREVIQRVAKMEFRTVHPNSAGLIAQKKSPTELVLEPGYEEVPLHKNRSPKEQLLEDNQPPGTTILRGRVIELNSEKKEFKIVSKGQGTSKLMVLKSDVKYEDGVEADLTNDRYVEVRGINTNAGFEVNRVVFLQSIVVKNTASVSGKDVKLAVPINDQRGWSVSIRLTDAGGDKMSKVTQENLQRPLAILVDGECLTAPTIQGTFSTNFEVTGSFTEKEVRNLAGALNNPLETPLKVVSEDSVTATFGQDTIKQGVIAGICGLIGILIFMIIYYRTAGLVAVVGLIVNAAILFGFMGITHSTLTMLGIAGIILTIGMGVDANVLIYERLREELKVSKSLVEALKAAYNRAFSAIFDGHMTSLITAVILFMLAGGSIKGFAVSLTIGIIASLFGSLLVTRTLFAWFPGLKNLSFLDLIKNKTFDFMGKAKIWLLLSCISIVLAAVGLAMKRETALGPDLRGGDKITLLNHPNLKAKQVEEIARTIDKSAIAQGKTTAQGSTFIEIRTNPDMGAKVLEAVEKQTGENLSDVRDNVTKVGSQIGQEMLKTSLIALAVGLLGIMLYLTLRFEFAFSLGAIAALFHDLIFCVGAILIAGKDINLLQIGALLTIAGYSVSDTVVIFDRVREYFRTHTGDLKQIINDAISSTLSRTLLTSVCTLITVFFLYFVGGPSLADFSFTIIVGIIVGTYSSIFVASPIVYWWVTRRNLDLKGEVLEADAARVLAEQGIEREVQSRK